MMVVADAASSRRCCRRLRCCCFVARQVVVVAWPARTRRCLCRSRSAKAARVSPSRRLSPPRIGIMRSLNSASFHSPPPSMSLAHAASAPTAPDSSPSLSSQPIPSTSSSSSSSSSCSGSCSSLHRAQYRQCQPAISLLCGVSACS